MKGGILYLIVHSNLLHIRSFHGVVRKLPQGLRVVILHCCYWSDVVQVYFIFDVFCADIFSSIFVYLFYFVGYFSKVEPYVP